jgi:hypothetical protein
MALDKIDKKTIGVTADNERILSALATAGRFNTDIEAAKFAMAHSIHQGMGRGTTEGAGTKWNVGSFDNDGSLKAIVEALYPDVTNPYRLIEYLINEGLRLLDKGDGLPPDVAGVILAAAETEGPSRGGAYARTNPITV